MEKQELESKIQQLEDQIKPLQARLNEIRERNQKEIEERVSKAERGNGDFTLDELRFAAKERCGCGAGMAYPLEIGLHGSWYCSDILRGVASREKGHSSPMPFIFYEVKSEYQPSADGATTRPVTEK